MVNVKKWRSLGAMMAGVIFLAACGGSDLPDDPSALQSEGDGETDGGGDGAALVIESWRTEDASLWEDELIPAFNEEYPDIEVSFEPTKNTEYNAALDSRLSGGTAGDLITCRPFDLSNTLYERGDFAELSDLDGIDEFSELALSAWSGDDGTPYCVPMASAIHGFYYNADVFDDLGIDVPTTHDEFLGALETLKDDGEYAPLAWGTADDWIASQTAFTSIGPNYWNGEEGRQGLINGDKSFTDAEFVEAWEALDDWQPYFPDGYQSIDYTDTQQMFVLEQAAIFPGGSWEITEFKDADFTIGVFPPPVPSEGDQCFISDHTDIGMGVNAASENIEDARSFLTWLTSETFANSYANALPGFFPLIDDPVEIDDSIAMDFLRFRDNCESTVRVTDEKLSADEPNTENQVRALTAQMWNGELTPQEVAEETQKGLESWYEPQQ